MTLPPLRDDPLPLATLAAELLARAARREDLDLAADPGMRSILADLSEALPVLRADEPHVMLWSRWATAVREGDETLAERERERARAAAER